MLNALYIASNSGKPEDVEDILNNIRNTLDNDYVIIMEQYGYSYEAIRYLKDNFPVMISSLYATSHWSTADVKKVREAIYNICHEEGMTGGVRVALVINPIDGGGPGTDYHWYYYDDETGTWSNKQGICPATDCYLPDNYSLYDENIVFSENQGICYGSNGSLIIGDFERPIGDSYIEHAEENGYTVNVGEFYITRQDGGDFQ